ncbi:MAG: Gfo/Idh/MocA family oxidoreductase [Trueperaceae bacterium]|nr:Gfo/Idh/MocA family oxidoreductase [Trueperaceae bacterium]
MKKIRWGIISTANIGTGKVIPAMQKCHLGEIVAIASRDDAKAKETAKQLGIPKAYGSYEDLLADGEIDAIYNPLPNHLHVPWTKKAAEAGKHVLCEKPIALSSAEAQDLLDFSRSHSEVKIMEAFMYRFHPQWQKAKELVDSGAIGELKTIQSFFSYFLLDPSNIRNQADIGGGGLMDIGCYNISLSRFIFAAEPKRVLATIDFDPTLKTDRLATAILEFDKGSSSFSCSTQLSPYQRVNIFGTQGRIEIEIPFNAPPDKPCKLWLQTGAGIEEMRFEITDQYTLQGDAFAEAILENKPVPTPLEDAVANMQVIERAFASAKQNAWV